MRPADLHDKILLIREQNGVDYFLKNNTHFVDVGCPSCGCIKNEVEFYKYGYSHIKCDECATLYVSPRPTEEMLFEYYSQYEAPSAWNEILAKTSDDRRYIQHLPRVEKLKKYIQTIKNKQDTFVELGSGGGSFAKAILESHVFKRVIASDISELCVELCKKQGLDAKRATIHDFHDNSIDFIAFNDLIEHIFNPIDFLTACYNKLTQNGMLMLSTPNGEGFDFKILKEITENIMPPEHIQYFNLISMGNMLEKVGFKIIDISTPGVLDVSIIKRQRNKKKFDLKSNNCFLDFLYSLDDAEVEDNFQKFLQDSKLSSHLLVFAMKMA